MTETPLALSEDTEPSKWFVKMLHNVAFNLLAVCSHIWEPCCGPQKAYPQHSRGVQLKLCRFELCDFRSNSNWPPLTAKPKLGELVGASVSEAACTSECSCDVNMADHWGCFIFSFFFLPQNAGERPTEHVQKGAAADRLYGVSLGTTDQRLVTQKPHR